MSYRYQIFIPSEPRFFVAHPMKSDIERCVRAIFKHITKSSKVLKEMGRGGGGGTVKYGL